jgi:hypothetical protein
VTTAFSAANHSNRLIFSVTPATVTGCGAQLGARAAGASGGSGGLAIGGHRCAQSQGISIGTSATPRDAMIAALTFRTMVRAPIRGY